MTDDKAVSMNMDVDLELELEIQRSLNELFEEFSVAPENAVQELPELSVDQNIINEIIDQSSATGDINSSFEVIEFVIEAVSADDSSEVLLLPIEIIEPKKFKCDTCNSYFSCKANLVSHKRTHTGEKPYPCMYCEQAFARSDTLGKHIRTHTGERPYKCDICKKSFNRSDYFTYHKKLHNKQTVAAPLAVQNFKPFKCSLCSRGFARRYDMNRHERIHSQFYNRCDFCKKIFMNRYHLNVHRGKHRPRSLIIYYSELLDIEEVAVIDADLESILIDQSSNQNI